MTLKNRKKTKDTSTEEKADDFEVNTKKGKKTWAKVRPRKNLKNGKLLSNGIAISAAPISTNYALSLMVMIASVLALSETPLKR